MEKVVYKPSVIFDSINNKLTIGKVYDVIKHIPKSVYSYDKIYIINDLGEEESFLIDFMGNTFFEDGTTEYRNNVIDGILL